MELEPSKKALITPAYIVECIFSDENYKFSESLLNSVGKIPRKARTPDRGSSRIVVICVVSHKCTLEHSLEGGDEAPIDPSTHNDKPFTKIYGVPWPLFVVLSDEFQQWCTINGHIFNLTDECPFTICTIACFWHMRTGCSITQFREGYSIAGSVFDKFFIYS
jgi:hypothetical protein